MPRRIRLTEISEGRWEARDLDVDLSAVGDTRQAALDQLDDVIVAATDDEDRKPTDEESRVAGVDPVTNRGPAYVRETLDDLRGESIFGDDIPENPSESNEDIDGDRSLDDIFDGDSDEKRQRRALRQEHPSGWLHLMQHDEIPYLVDALLGFPPDREFTATELAEHACVPRENVEDSTALLLEVELIESVADSSPARYRVADSAVARAIFELNSALTTVGDD